MASNKNAPALQSTKMPIPADDRRDEQFHLDITKKNDCFSAKTVKKY